MTEFQEAGITEFKKAEKGRQPPQKCEVLSSMIRG